MVLGELEILYIISCIIMLCLFLPIYYKILKNSGVSRGHKVAYGVIFLGLVTAGFLSISVFHLLVEWNEVLMFNIVWIPPFLLMLQDLAGHRLARKIVFGKLFLAVGLTILLIFCLTFTLIEFLWYISTGVWLGLLPLPIFIILLLVMGPLFVLTARMHRKGEEEFTDGAITSGGMTFLYLIAFVYGSILIIAGLPHGPDYWMPRYVSYVLLIVGTILVAYSLPKLLKERRKRKEAGYGW